MKRFLMYKINFIVLFIAVLILFPSAYGQKDSYHRKADIPQLKRISAGELSIESPVGTTSAFAFSPSGYVFAGTEGGILRSKDNGMKWEYFAVSPDTYYLVKALVFTPPSRLFAGGGKSGLTVPLQPVLPGSDYDNESETVSNPNGGVFVSNDNGSTWEQYKNILNDIRIISLAINKQGHLFAGTDSGSIFCSIDGSKTWKKLIEWENGGFITGIVINSQSYIFAGTKTGVYRSIDNGNIWEAWSNNINDVSIKKLYMSMNGHLLATTNNGELYLSSGEENWWKLITIKPDVLFYAAVFDSSFNIYAGTNQGIFVSSKFGKIWGEPVILDNSPEVFIYSLAVKDKGAVSTCFAGIGDKIFVMQYAFSKTQKGHRASIKTMP